MPHKDIPIMLEGMTTEERQKFLQDMSDGYAKMQREAEERSRDAPNEHEEKAWRNVALYCEMMATLSLHGALDEPDTHLSFYSFDERIGDKKLLLEVMQDRENGKQTTWTQAHQNVVGAALWTLTAKEREIAELYYIAKVKRKSMPDMLKMPLSTIDTHIRNINVKWRQFAGDVANGEPVQASWLGMLHDVTEMQSQLPTENL